MIMETKVKDKVQIEPGAYEGVWGGYSVEVFGANKMGTSVILSTVDGVRGMGIPVIVIVDQNADAFVYDNNTRKNTRHEKDDEPISPAYIRELVAQRKRNIGPLVTQMNAVLIQRSSELAKTGQIYVDVADVCPNGTSRETIEALAAAFCEKGFQVSLTSGKSNEEVFDVKLA